MRRLTQFQGKRNSPTASLLRRLGLIAVFLMTGWLFWQNNNQNLNRVFYFKTIHDTTKGLTLADKESLLRFSKALKKKYGLEFKLRISNERIVKPRLTPKTLFIGINPRKKEWQIILPVLVERAMPAEFVSYIKTKHFKPYFEQENWQDGLQQALRLIWNQLAAMAREKETR